MDVEQIERLTTEEQRKSNPFWREFDGFGRPMSFEEWSGLVYPQQPFDEAVFHAL